MLSTAQQLAAKLESVLSDPRIKQSDIADACGVSKQAVQGWKKTGRIDKKHLPKLAQVTGKPLEWWLSIDGPQELLEAQTQKPSEEALVDAFSDWRLQASPRSLETINKLALLAKKNALRDEDWTLIDQLASRFKKTP
ncbi:helix-turn-helix domain-containing protein [Comamonas terrae]|uniref:Helix-turn-helix domain-containing protein n=1 Tax=Comamonas terrae TaxID=673548 RepID=A0ABW5UPC0_9BURK|nr:helix-turn-helix transcriptional regulator [Comamonas terrae]